MSPGHPVTPGGSWGGNVEAVRHSLQAKAETVADRGLQTTQRVSQGEASSLQGQESLGGGEARTEQPKGPESIAK